MKFDRLNASIQNNRQEEPTLYMAFCMIESLFADMEAETGLDLSRCPMGDDMFPTKMRWLSRCILDIYEERREELDSRPRMADAMSKLTAAEKALADISQVAEELEAAQGELSRLQEALQQGEKKKAEIVFLTEEIEKAKKQVQELDRFDPESAKRELSDLRSKNEKAQTEQAKLRSELEDAQQRTQQLEGQALADGALLQKLKEEQEQLEKELAQLQNEIPGKRFQRDTLEGKLSNATDEKNNLDSEIKRMQSLLDTYDETTLLPLRQKKDTLGQKVDGLEQERRALQQELEECEKQRSQWIVSISRKKTEKDELIEKTKRDQDKLAQLERECQDLKDEYAGAITKLSEVQAEVEDLENRKLPEAVNLTKKEQSRKEELSEEIEHARCEKAKLEEEIQALEKESPRRKAERDDLREKLKNTQAIYDGFVVEVTAGTEELRSLEEKIKELREKNVEGTYLTYRKQQEEELRRLEEIQAAMQTVWNELRDTKNDLEAKEQELTKLREQKKTCEDACRAADALRVQLGAVATDEYVRKTKEIGQRLQLLKTVWSKLSGSVNLLHAYLGKEAFQNIQPLDERFGIILEELKNRTEKLHADLLNCADSLKMEERR